METSSEKHVGTSEGSRPAGAEHRLKDLGIELAPRPSWK
jgi:hypothetical protein